MGDFEENKGLPYHIVKYEGFGIAKSVFYKYSRWER
jgi:hypothetical protein